MKKFMLRVMPVLFVCMIVGIDVLAASNTVMGIVNGVWDTVLSVLQVVAVAAIVFAGVRYMTSNSDMKAEIKGSMIGLVVGAIFVFGASAVVKLITQAGSEVGIK